ncbi:MAG: hypothetical protein ACI9G1_003314 [Pirellulaceae bacterium]|jgi:hypothetical protein
MSFAKASMTDSNVECYKSTAGDVVGLESENLIVTVAECSVGTSFDERIVRQRICVDRVHGFAVSHKYLHSSHADGIIVAHSKRIRYLREVLPAIDDVIGNRDNQDVIARAVVL